MNMNKTTLEWKIQIQEQSKLFATCANPVYKLRFDFSVGPCSVIWFQYNNVPYLHMYRFIMKTTRPAIFVWFAYARTHTHKHTISFLGTLYAYFAHNKRLITFPRVNKLWCLSGRCTLIINCKYAIYISCIENNPTKIIDTC